MSYSELFHELNETDLPYVVPRKYDALPESTIDDDGDVDIIFGESNFDYGVAVCKQNGFLERKSRMKNRKSLVSDLVTSPLSSSKTIISDPIDALSRVLKGEVSTKSNSRHQNIKLYDDELMLDLRDNLAYKSPMNRKRIPVDTAVTEGMINRRRKHNGIYVPSPADELAHIVPHCLFDKKGDFSPYYQKRCEELLMTVQNDDEQKQLFDELLELIFYDASSLVYTKLQNQEYNSMFSELQSFSKY